MSPWRTQNKRCLASREASQVLVKIGWVPPYRKEVEVVHEDPLRYKEDLAPGWGIRLVGREGGRGSLEFDSLALALCSSYAIHEHEVGYYASARTRIQSGVLRVPLREHFAD